MNKDARIRILSIRQYVSDEFLERELGFRIEIIDPETFVLKGSKLFVAIIDSDIEIWLRMLKDSELKSITVLLLSNETQNLNIYRKLFATPAIRFIFAQYAPMPSRPFGLNSIIGTMIDNPRSLWKFNCYRIIFRSICRSIRNNLFYLMNRHRYSSLVLGYSNNFFNELIEYLNIDKGSITSLLDLSIPKEIVEGKNMISFVGQGKGLFRENLLQNLEGKKNFDLVINSNWGKPNDNQKLVYIRSLLSNVLILCPPGYLSNLTFRYLETVICNSIPVTLDYWLQDWEINSFWTKALPIMNRISIKNLSRYLMNLSSGEIETLSLNIKNSAVAEIMENRFKISEINKI